MTRQAMRGSPAACRSGMPTSACRPDQHDARGRERAGRKDVAERRRYGHQGYGGHGGKDGDAKAQVEHPQPAPRPSPRQPPSGSAGQPCAPILFRAGIPRALHEYNLVPPFPGPPRAIAPRCARHRHAPMRPPAPSEKSLPRASPLRTMKQPSSRSTRAASIAPLEPARRMHLYRSPSSTSWRAAPLCCSIAYRPVPL